MPVDSLDQTFLAVYLIHDINGEIKVYLLFFSGGAFLLKNKISDTLSVPGREDANCTAAR